MKLNSITALRRLGLMETLAFRFSDNKRDSGWDFNGIYKYYVDMTTKSHWRNL